MKLPEIWRGQGSYLSPFHEFNRMQRRLDRVFDELFADVTTGEGSLPAVDFEEKDTQYVLSCDLPGVKKDDVKIELRDNQLIISGERKEEGDKKEGTLVSRERYYGTFTRSFILPSTVDANKAEASYDHGVLHVMIPKTQLAQPKLITIKDRALPEDKKKAA